MEGVRDLKQRQRGMKMSMLWTGLKIKAKEQRVATVF